MDREKDTPELLGNQDESHSLETPSTIIEPTTKSEAGTGTPPTTNQPDDTTPPATETPTKLTNLRAKTKGFASRFNIYLLLFFLLLLIAGGAIVIATMQARKNNSKEAAITNQSLSQSALQQLSNSDASVGTAKQTLNVQSNAVFAGQVLVRSNLEVAGTIKVGGALSLPGITVSGASNFDQIQAGTLAVAGNAAIQGNTTIQRNLTVNGSGSFGTLSAQQLAVGSLQLNGDLVLTRHTIAGGPIPKKADGNALGSGGTSSLSGSDSAGTITINTGSGPAAGCFLTATFAQKFAGTPRVLLTPVSSAAAGLPYYVTRTSTSFSICTAAPAAANQNISFDYAIFG